MKKMKIMRGLKGVMLWTLVMTLGSLGVQNTEAASVPDIKIALVYPLSGALSRNGSLTLQSNKAAINWVNEKGGIKSLGGAKLVPVLADSGSTLEGASSAMERVCRDPDIVMAMGSWSSSLTMASTEVTERMGIPHFSSSYADALNSRKFKFGFYVTTPSSGLTNQGLPKLLELAKRAGQVVKTAMIVGDKTVSAKVFYDAAKKIFAPLGIQIISEEGWSMGTLVDATPVMQKVKTMNPDIVLFHASAISEAQMCLMKKKELGIHIPFMSFGGYAADPSFRTVGADALEGLVALTGTFPHKHTPPEWINRTLEQCRKEYSDEPWVGQDLSMGWGKVPIMAEILEKAGTRDRKVIREVAAKLDIHDVSATRHTLKQGMAFDPDGRLAKKYQETLIVQWQGGVPRAVYPPALALAKPKWVSKNK